MPPADERGLMPVLVVLGRPLQPVAFYRHSISPIVCLLNEINMLATSAC